ncbi:hypothetical protein XENOCAPTIV_007890 [Xenoophorus captivus]|uniref:Myotrophin n=1 Tax=Xenoophorus captivus TaxID=1517983 RepID=A0ABV0SGQ1_9TELE
MDEVKAKFVTSEDVNRTLESGRKPLHYAADFGQAEVVEYLISKGADVNSTVQAAGILKEDFKNHFYLISSQQVPDKHGLTPLISACYEGHLQCVKILIEKVQLKGKRSIRGPDLNTYTAIHSKNRRAAT